MGAQQEPPRTQTEAISRALQYASVSTRNNPAFKQWVIDQMVRCLTGPEDGYSDWVKNQWDTGEPPPPYDYDD